MLVFGQVESPREKAQDLLGFLTSMYPQPHFRQRSFQFSSMYICKPEQILYVY